MIFLTENQITVKIPTNCILIPYINSISMYPQKPQNSKQNSTINFPQNGENYNLHHTKHRFNIIIYSHYKFKTFSDFHIKGKFCCVIFQMSTQIEYRAWANHWIIFLCPFLLLVGEIDKGKKSFVLIVDKEKHFSVYWIFELLVIFMLDVYLIKQDNITD